MLGHGYGEKELYSLIEKLNALLEEEELDPQSIHLTEKAAAKYKEILAAEGKSDHGLRFSEKMAGCSGFEYILDYSPHAHEDDTIFHSHGIEIHVKKEMVPRLIGAEIDYIESLQSTGFKVSNPNVKSACGCGSSHGY